MTDALLAQPLPRGSSATRSQVERTPEDLLPNIIRRKVGRPMGSVDRRGRCLHRVKFTNEPAFRSAYRRYAEMQGDQLRHVREELDIPADELAAACGVSPKTVWKWESGVNPPTLRRLVQISFALGVLVMDLVPRAS